MAREFGKQGLHIVHPVIDGPIDTPFVRERFLDLVASRPADGLLAPDDSRHVLDAALPEAQRLDLRARPAPLARTHHQLLKELP